MFNSISRYKSLRIEGLAASVFNRGARLLSTISFTPRPVYSRGRGSGHPLNKGIFDPKGTVWEL